MDLKIVAAAIVVQSKLSKTSKLQLLNFIQYEATIPQIKAFLLDGEIVTLDEHAEEIVNKRFEISSINEIMDPVTIYAGMVAAIAAAVIGKMAYNIAKRYSTKAQRTCRKYTGNAKQKCLDIVKKQSLQSQIQSLSPRYL